MRFLSLSAGVLTTAVLLVSPGSAGAHALLLEASPPHEAVLARSPERIVLRFNSRLEHRLTRITLTDSQGRAVPLVHPVSGDPVGRDSQARLTVLLPPLPPGTYILRYRVLATDGHITEGLLRFIVNPTGPRP